MTSDTSGKVDVISKHETISECHVAMTARGFEQVENTYCLITEDGVDWKIK
jgi:hypothetical protein